VTLDWRSPPEEAVAEGAPWALDIIDDGEGLSAAGLSHLQTALNGQRYEQLGGLGLMLSDLIARAHGGRLLLLNGTAGLHLQITGEGQPGPSPLDVTRFTI